MKWSAEMCASMKFTPKAQRTSCAHEHSLKGMYVSVNPNHLFRYVNERTLWYNEGHGGDSDRFRSAVRNAWGRRLTLLK